MARKKDFQSPFHFLISLFVDTPESSGQRFRGSPCPEPGQPIRAKDFYLSLLPFPARYRFIVEDRGSPLWRVATDNSCRRLLLVVTPPGYRSVSAHHKISSKFCRDRPPGRSASIDGGSYVQQSFHPKASRQDHRHEKAFP